MNKQPVFADTVDVFELDLKVVDRFGRSAWGEADDPREAGERADMIAGP